MQLKEHEGIVARKDSFVIDPRILKCELGYNVRDLNTPECKEHIAGLKESIAVNSVRVPLEVRLKGEDIYIVAGHCRWMAVMQLIAEGREEIKGVPCVQEPKSINDAERVLNLAISNSGKPLTTLEIAEVVKRLEGFGWTPEDIRRRMQWKSRATVTQHEEIAALSEGTKKHISNGEVSASLARGIAKGVDPEFAEKLIRENLEENKRIRGTGKRNVKVTKKTLSRDATPKVEKQDPPISETLREPNPNYPDRELDAETATAMRETSAPQTTPDTGPKPRELFDALETLAKEARNQIKAIEVDCPTWNYSALAEAVEHAERIIERVNGDNTTLPAGQNSEGSVKFDDREEAGERG